MRHLHWWTLAAGFLIGTLFGPMLVQAFQSKFGS